MKSRIRVLSAALLVALAPVAEAHTSGDVDAQVRTLDATAANQGQTQVANRIAASFGSLAGSADNTLALVNALRNGTAVSLTAPTTTSGGTTTSTTTTSTTITPPTGKMGWGNVFISLALARTVLANAGITNPTADQLQAALTGGTVTSPNGTSTALQGVLTLRASGMGWGQIAQAEGTKLGPVVSSIKSENHRVALLGSGSSTSTMPTTPTKSLRFASAKSSTLTTASGATLHARSGGITTASGSAGHGKSSLRGITTASGATTHAGSGKGLTTAAGGASNSVHGNSGFGRGLVTAAGSSVASTAVTTNPGGSHSAGVITASGAVSTGLTTAQGGGTTAHHGRGKSGG